MKSLEQLYNMVSVFVSVPRVSSSSLVSCSSSRILCHYESLPALRPTHNLILTETLIISFPADTYSNRQRDKCPILSASNFPLARH